MKRTTIKRLRERRTVSLHLPAGATLLVARGMGWLTTDRDSKDRFLCPGKTYRTDRTEHLVLQAVDRTVVYAVHLAEEPVLQGSQQSLWNLGNWLPAQRPLALEG